MSLRTWTPLASAAAFALAFLHLEASARATSCVEDRDCPSATPACNAGLCAECTPTNTARCTARSPRCLMPFGICGCESSEQCGPGLLCTRPAPASGSPPYCTGGCTGTGQGTCPSGYQCNAQGQCDLRCVPLTPNQCPFAPRNICPVLPLITCVECVTNGDCAGKTGAEVCDFANDCVQCERDTDCTRAPASPHGPRCIGSGKQRSCGCNADTDCGPGRICDETVQACIEGCRLPDGGKCPPGTQCRMADAGGERCVAIPDAGPPPDSGPRRDAGGSSGDGGSDGGRSDAGSRGDGDIAASLEGGGCSCTLSPAEDALPLGGLAALGGLLALFGRRRRVKETRGSA
ncbi:MYXO-CTERM sorting domain-containing protein [Pendulispora albinea]|uniref:MYXO-CTERM sorting domain-containing protein n=1 Tax=Pendulispora albinea TaxID=2741071 RepID=A0ABZ2M349_9BACT